MSRENAELVYENGAVLKLKVADLLDWLPEEVTRELLSLACANGEALRMLASQIVAAGTPYEDRPEDPACDAWLSRECAESLRLALMPLLGPAYAEALQSAIREREAALTKLKPMMEWAQAELQIEAFRVSGRIPDEYALKRAETLRRACIEIAAKDNPYLDRRPKQLAEGGAS